MVETLLYLNRLLLNK